MAFLVVGAVSVEMAAMRRTDGAVVGSTRRALSGALRTSVRAVKREWQGTSVPLSATDHLALLTAVGSGGVAIVTVSGDAVDSPGGFSALVTVGGADYVASGADHYRSVSLTVQEV